jgi:hypothetical protein
MAEDLAAVFVHRPWGAVAVNGREVGVDGFDDPIHPRPEELRAWAYHPETVPIEALPPDWDLIIAGDPLAPTLFELAMDSQCPVRLFALHCMYIYAADSVRPSATSRRRRRLKSYVQRAEETGDEWMSIWAHNCRTLTSHPSLFDHHEWIEGGLTRRPRRIDRLGH